MDRNSIISIILQHRAKLITSIKSNILPCITQLYNKKYFTVKDCQEVKGESTPASQANKILDLAVSKKSKNLMIFVNTLLTVLPELNELFTDKSIVHIKNHDSVHDDYTLSSWHNEDNQPKRSQVAQNQEMPPTDTNRQIERMNREETNLQDNDQKDGVSFGLHMNKNHYIFVAGGINDVCLCNQVEVFDTSNLSWTTLYPMNAGCYGACGGILTNKFMVCGGFVETDGLSNKTRYCDLKTMKWDSLESLKEPKKYSSACIWNNRLIIIGGLKNTESLKKVEVYCHNLGVWSRISFPAMISRRYGCTSVAIKNHLVVMGGQSEHEGAPLSSVESYQLSHKAWEKPQWQELNKMCRPRTFAAAAVWRDHIIVAGGFDGVQKLDSVEWYDSKTNKWKLLTRMAVRRDNCQAVVIGDYFIVIGGNDGKHNLRDVDAFDIIKKKWHSLPGLRYCRSSFACGHKHLQL